MSYVKLVAVHTSQRAVSLQKVTKNICDVVAQDGIVCTTIPILELVEEAYKNYNGSLIVIPFDLSLCLNYFVVARTWKFNYGKPIAFYTTIEGDVYNPSMYEWVRRDLEFIANSQYTKNKLSRHGYRVPDVIYHGIDLNLYDYTKYGDDAKVVREKLGFKPDDFVVLYIASSHPRKCHDLAAQTTKILQEVDKSIKIVVVSDSTAQRYYSGVNNVMLLTDFGNLGEEFMPILYKVADIYAQFSCAEGFGLPILESLAMGKLVVHAKYMPLTEITTDDTSVRVPVVKRRWIQGGGSAILFEMNIYEPQMFASAIIKAKERVLTEPSLPDKCRKRAEEFDMHKVYKPFTKYF
jgi:glycosyltransferase involved in cell wall biosynthesis